jgi:general stress protein 26
MTDQEKSQVDALTFLKRHKTGVLATAGANGTIHASVVYYTADDNFNVYIMTQTNSRKYEALKAHLQVAFTIFTEDTPQTLQMEGVATDISLDEKAGSKKDELFDVLNKNPFFYPPITKLDIHDTAIVWIQPKWIRWADYAFGEDGTDRVLKEITIKGGNS